jgi:hypothetical protein
VWDLAGGRAPISEFWRAARELDGAAQDESNMAGAGQGRLTALFKAASLHDVEEVELSASVDHSTFDEWWDPFTLGVGPSGAYARSLDAGRLSAVRERARQLLPDPPFTLTVYAWAARGLA